MATLNANALTTLADVKESLGLASSDHSKDNLIIRKINSASQQISNYCSRVFQATDYVEEYNGSNIDELVLNQRPVNGSVVLEYRGSAVNQTNWREVNADYYFVDASPGILKLLFPASGRWNRWRASYNAGYTPGNIPSDLQEACATLASYYVTHANPIVNVRSRQEGQRREDYYQGIQGFKNLLQQLGLEQIIDGYANWPLRSE